MNSIGKKTFTATVAALGLAMTSAATPANAGSGAVFAAGVFGGLAVGAMAAGAAPYYAPHYYAPGYYGYYAPRRYYAPTGYYAPARAYAQCWIERQPVMNRWGQVVSYRNRRVCG